MRDDELRHQSDAIDHGGTVFPVWLSDCGAIFQGDDNLDPISNPQPRQRVINHCTLMPDGSGQ